MWSTENERFSSTNATSNHQIEAARWNRLRCKFGGICSGRLANPNSDVFGEHHLFWNKHRFFCGGSPTLQSWEGMGAVRKLSVWAWGAVASLASFCLIFCSGEQKLCSVLEHKRSTLTLAHDWASVGGCSCHTAREMQWNASFFPAQGLPVGIKVGTVISSKPPEEFEQETQQPQVAIQSY